MYRVLARKWRPRGFDELIGQRHVARTLGNSVESGRIAHAYLFAGQRGTGKTTVARILAKCLNCETGPTATPCNVCAPCVEIAEGRSLDVMEVDAASRTKVEQTRELMDMLNYAPVRDRYKVVIVDEAHMLSKSSFNALLKTLEEPPPHVVFVLATTEAHKVLPTIQSRCQQFEFRRVPHRELTEHLRRICADEGIRIGDASLGRVARAGDGSVRDSLSLLERVVAYCGPEVDDTELLRVLGAVDSETIADLVRALAARDAAAMLQLLDRTVDEGHDLTHLWTELITALRDLLFRAVVPDRDDLLSRSPEEAARLGEAAAGLGRDDLNRAFHVLAELENGLKASSQPRFLFEATLVRLATLGELRPIEELLARLDGTGPPEPAPPRPATTPGAPGALPRAPSAPAQKKSPAMTATAPAADASAAGAPGAPLGERLLDALRRGKPMLAAIVDQARSVAVEGDVLVLRYDPAQAAITKPLAADDKREALQAVVSEIAGRPLTLRIETAGTPGDADAGPAGPARAVPAPPRGGRGARTYSNPDPQLLAQAKQDPAVRKLLREFGAQVLDVQPLEARPVDRIDPEPLEEPE